MVFRSLGQEESPGEGNGNPLQYSCLENPMDRGAWQTTVLKVTKSKSVTTQEQNSNNKYIYIYTFYVIYSFLFYSTIDYYHILDIVPCVIQ